MTPLEDLEARKIIARMGKLPNQTKVRREQDSLVIVAGCDLPGLTSILRKNGYTVGVRTIITITKPKDHQ